MLRRGVVLGFGLLSACASAPSSAAARSPTAEQMAAWTPQQRCHWEAGRLGFIIGNPNFGEAVKVAFLKNASRCSSRS